MPEVAYRNIWVRKKKKLSFPVLFIQILTTVRLFGTSALVSHHKRLSRYKNDV